MRLEGVRVPASARLGAEGDGVALALRTLELMRPTVGAAACGMAARALAETRAFVGARRRGGAPLAERESVRAKLAEMATELEAARLLVYKAAWLRETTASGTRLDGPAAMAKLYATEAAGRIVDAAVQLHGGAGVVRGAVVERLYREVRALRIYEGTSEIQKLVIAQVAAVTAGAVAQRRARRAAPPSQLCDARAVPCSQLGILARAPPRRSCLDVGDACLRASPTTASCVIVLRDMSSCEPLEGRRSGGRVLSRALPERELDLPSSACRCSSLHALGASAPSMHRARCSACSRGARRDPHVASAILRRRAASALLATSMLAILLNVVHEPRHPQLRDDGVLEHPDRRERPCGWRRPRRSARVGSRRIATRVASGGRSIAADVVRSPAAARLFGTLVGVPRAPRCASRHPAAARSRTSRRRCHDGDSDVERLAPEAREQPRYGAVPHRSLPET